MSDPDVLVRIFETGLGLSPTRSQTEVFRADLARSSHELLDASLRELAGAGIRDATVTDARAAVFAVYWRKLAELGDLFPVFFMFETSFRAFAAARLAVIYGAEDWWRPVHEAVADERDPFRLCTLNGRATSRTTIRIVSHLLRHAPRDAVLGPTSYALVSAGTLAHVSQLIDAHWGDMVGALHPRHGLRPGGRLTRSEFGGLFDKVRNARNDAFHHRPVSSRARVVAIVEELLDLLDISLARSLGRVESARGAHIGFRIEPEARHQ